MVNAARMFDTTRPKQLMKMVLGRSSREKLSDEEFELYQGFIINTMMGSGYEVKDFHKDYAPFEKMLRKSYTKIVPWQRLHELHVSNNKAWPVFENHDDKCVLAWALNGSIMTEWVEFTPDALLNDTLELKTDSRTKKMADEEAAFLGLELRDGFTRPNGAAPDGSTWSYYYGEWKPEDWLKNRKRVTE
jgi:hypothetical protein